MLYTATIETAPTEDEPKTTKFGVMTGGPTGTLARFSVLHEGAAGPVQATLNPNELSLLIRALSAAADAIRRNETAAYEARVAEKAAAARRAASR